MGFLLRVDTSTLPGGVLLHIVPAYRFRYYDGTVSAP